MITWAMRNFRKSQEINQLDEKFSIIRQQSYQDKGKQILTIKGPKTMMTIMLMVVMMTTTTLKMTMMADEDDVGDEVLP